MEFLVFLILELYHLDKLIVNKHKYFEISTRSEEAYL
jgi:hypothetical protein